MPTPERGVTGLAHIRNPSISTPTIDEHKDFPLFKDNPSARVRLKRKLVVVGSQYLVLIGCSPNHSAEFSIADQLFPNVVKSLSMADDVSARQAV